MLFAFSVAPAVSDDTTGSVSTAVAAAISVVRESGLPHRTDAMFTTIEGGWDECLAVIKGAVDAVAAVSPRVSLVVKADIRPGFTGELDGKLDRLEQALAARASRD
ncbi:MTH1187 family thiamine-binding protein [Lapillicoccus sp.]|uniref:thiamine-binding protein n=1 Tax=Lapillicoccus sp. TaxID=1909287 RepID=UPI003982E49C